MPFQNTVSNFGEKGTTTKIFTVIMFILGFYFAIDLLVLVINLIANTRRPGGCAEEGWITGFFDMLLINNNVKPPTCTEQASNNTLGVYSSYAGTGNSCLYESDVNRLVNDIRNDYFVEGYTIVELLAYIIVPTITILSIGYWLISTRKSKAEITFWALVATLIATGLRTVVQTTGGVEMSQSEASCLTHITNKLNFEAGDELQYQFMARKGDGNSCMINGTFLGTGSGGVASPDQPASYSGNMDEVCNSESLPLY